MEPSVKPRPRRERAQATRLRIIEGAAVLFAEHGYSGTTMEGVGRAAGVAVQTVYFVFHTKAQLLIDTMLTRGWGPQPDSPAARRWITQAADAPDGARRLAIAVDRGVDIYQRVAPLFPALVAGSSADPDVRAAWQRIVDERRLGMSRLVALMGDRAELREGVTATFATDLIMGLHRHELYLAFTAECGWSVETYKAWLYATLCRQLLPTEVAIAALGARSPATTGTSFVAALWSLPL